MLPASRATRPHQCLRREGTYKLLILDSGGWPSTQSALRAGSQEPSSSSLQHKGRDKNSAESHTESTRAPEAPLCAPAPCVTGSHPFLCPGCAPGAAQGEPSWHFLPLISGLHRCLVGRTRTHLFLLLPARSVPCLLSKPLAPAATAMLTPHSRVSWRAQPQRRALSPQSSQISAPNPRRLVSRRWSHIARAAEPQPTHKFAGNKTWHGAQGTCSHCRGDVPSPTKPPAHPGAVTTGPWGHDGDQAGPAGQGVSPKRGLQGRSSPGGGCPGVSKACSSPQVHKRAAFLAGGKTSCAELGEPPRS